MMEKGNSAERSWLCKANKEHLVEDDFRGKVDLGGKDFPCTMEGKGETVESASIR